MMAALNTVTNVLLFLEKLPVEAKPPWSKQAIELEEDTAVSEEAT